MDEYRRVEVKFFANDDKNLDFLMKETGIKEQSTAVRFALQSFKEHIELTRVLRELATTQNRILEEQVKIDNKLHDIYFGRAE